MAHLVVALAIAQFGAPAAMSLVIHGSSELAPSLLALFLVFVPPYVGHRGWLGVRLDRRLDWDELAGICEDAYAEVAPAKLLRALSRSS